MVKRKLISAKNLDDNMGSWVLSNPSQAKEVGIYFKHFIATVMGSRLLDADGDNMQAEFWRRHISYEKLAKTTEPSSQVHLKPTLCLYNERMT